MLCGRVGLGKTLVGVTFEQGAEGRETKNEPHMYVSEDRGQMANSKVRALKLNAGLCSSRAICQN